MTQQGLALFQPGKSRPVLWAGKNLATGILHLVVHWRHLLLTQACVTSCNPYNDRLKTGTNPLAQHHIDALSCPVGSFKG